MSLTLYLSHTVHNTHLCMHTRTQGGAFSHPLLRESAVLALSKYMCISGEVCSRHLDLLFTALAASPEVAVRANIVVALGDLAFRFPNAVEPWNALIYARLRDPSPRVRANTLMVLTHLILNDMVKVKGLVSDIALCLRDPLPRLRDMAKVRVTRLIDVRTCVRALLLYCVWLQ
jgi:condensin complex subunit 1